MAHVLFYLPNGQVIQHSEYQDGLENLATNPATNLKIVVDEMPNVALSLLRVNEEGQLIVTEA